MSLTFASACGATSGGAADDDDQGDAGTGGGGSDDPNAMLTVSDDGFVIIDPVRWSANATPTVTGTVTDPRAIVEVHAGEMSLGTATVSGVAWTFTMPDHALGVVPTDLAFVAHVGTGPAESVTHKYAVDVTPPALGALPTTIQNELNDVVTLGGDGTILSHLHNDTGRITLGADGCPDVFKHGYLMDPGDGNPIHWELRATDDGIGLDAASAMVRIGRKDGTLFGAWQPIAGSGTSDTVDFAFDAVRSGSTGLTFLGTTEAQMVIQLSAKDLLGRETTLERCWNHHPLAVPLLATAGAQATNHGLALPSNRLEASSVFHAVAEEMIDPGSGGLSILDYDVFNGTDEHAFVTFTLDRPAMTTRRDYVRQGAATAVHNITRVLCSDTNGKCDPAVHPVRVGNIGSVLTESTERFVVRVVPVHTDGSFGNELPCSVCDATHGVFRFDLAGKAAVGDPGAHYRVMTGIREVTNLFPSGAAGDVDAGPFHEAPLGSTSGTVSITGKLIGSPYSGCSHTVLVQIGNTGEFNEFCDQTTDFRQYRALTRIEIGFSAALQNQAASAPAPALLPRSLGSLAGPRRIPAFSYVSIEALPPTF